ncbi:MAG: hypothetical protein OYM47_15650 [Gemmatimonadota bacterium]|nr:hypothetical protein [Gemmatimonadota bacterium]
MSDQDQDFIFGASISQRLGLLLDGSIVPSPHSIDLSHSALSDYMYRDMRKNPHLAELYHENSKINPHSTLQVPTDKILLEDVRRWFFTTAYSFDEESEVNGDAGFSISYKNLPLWLQSPLQPFTKPGSLTNLLFAVDLVLVHDRLLVRVVPQSENLWIERELVNRDVRSELCEIFWIKPPPKLDDDFTMLFVVACPWRYMLIYGPRGYRHTLLDIGRLLGHLEHRSNFDGHIMAVHQDFLDTKADEFVQADGVERSVYAILTLLPNNLD